MLPFFLPLVKRTIILVTFSSDFWPLVNLGKLEVSFFLFPPLNFSSFWQKAVLKIGLFFLVKNGELTIFIKILNVFKLYFSKKSCENLTIFGQFFKKNSKESPIFSKSSRFHALCTKSFQKLTLFFPWKRQKVFKIWPKFWKHNLT